jgi:TP901 family phage tail tape measure protein
MLELAHSGMTLAEVETTLPGVIALATSASEDQATAAKLTVDVLDAYGLSASSAAEVTDLLALASARGEQELSPLAEGLVEASRAAKAFDQDLPGTAAILDRLADLGKGGAEGAAVFGQTLAKLRRPSQEAQRALRSLGLDASDLSKMGADGAVRMRPLEEILGLFRARGLDAGKALSIFGPKLGATALGLVRTSEDARTFADELRGAGGAADRLAKVQLGGGVGTLEEFNAKWERLLVTVARSGLIEGLGQMATVAGRIFAWFQTLSPATQRWTVALGAVAATVGPALILVGQFSTGLSALAKVGSLLGAANLGGKLAGILGAAGPWAVLAVAIGSIALDVMNLIDAINGTNSEAFGGPKTDRPAVDALAFPAGPAAGPERVRALGRTGAGAGAARADVSGRVQVEFTNTPAGTRVRASQTGDVPIDVDAGYVLAAGLSG